MLNTRRRVLFFIYLVRGNGSSLDYFIFRLLTPKKEHGLRKVTTSSNYSPIPEAGSFNEEVRRKERYPPLSEAEEESRSEEQEALQGREAVPRGL